MDYELTLRREAEKDLQQAFHYYESIRPGLGHDFLGCVDLALDKIGKQPQLYRKVIFELRRIPVARFSYRIFFLMRGKQVIVTAVFHVRSDPAVWRSRGLE